MEMLKNLTIKQKQKIKILVILGSVLLVIIVGVSFTGKRTAAVKESAKKDRKYSVLSEKVEKDLWIAAEGQNIKALEKSNEELRAEMTKLRQQMDQTKKTEKSETYAVKKEKAQPPGVPPVPPPSTKKPDKPDMHVPGQSPGKGGSEKQLDKSGGASGSIRTWENKESSESKQDKTKTKQDDSVWIPTGSITKAVILSGMDVPTSLAAKSEPYPTLMMLSDLSLLPNRFRMDLKECFIVGAGYGNMVEERAYIRTETLSCIKNDGTPWEVSLKGQVMGEDGKLGMRGKVITKQGRQIAMSIITGILSGLGHALQPQTAMSYVNVSKQSDGKVTTLMPDLGDVALGAGLSGTGNALARVSDYYLKLAEQIYPVIEIDPGREVDIVIVKGGKLTPQENKGKHQETADASQAKKVKTSNVK